MSQTIPSVDLNDFLSGDAQRKAAFVQELGAAYEEIGFVALKNHRLSDELVEALYREVQAFFNLPTNIKEHYEIEGIAGQRGYTGFGKEHAKGRNTGDLKEFWHFGQYVEDEDPIAAEYPANVDVKELADFNSVGKEAYQTLEATGLDMLRALALYLGLDENYFDAHVHNGNSILRPIHYPPITEEPKDAVRAAEHGDINLITLLMGASADGLQVLNKANEWIPVTALPGQIIVNVGDMMQRHTNNKLRSTIHRVVNPPKEKWAQSRFSIPFFMHPRSEMPLNCLEECITENNPKAYEDITAGGFLEERLKEIGLKK
ncbi:MAG: isopenicillin N synthase family oxygenase [Bacteroidetes bacterium]|nr:isopenicillin N synthase family oxygenase [Bacteroidota bacterium]